jgi:DNA-binding GntR family transcriptional regulator
MTLALPPLGVSPVLIDQVHERLMAAIVDGTLKPGERLRQEGLAEMLGVSRQPISHALQLLKRQRLVEELGKRGLTVATIDAARVRDLYQVRGALDALAARLAARRVAGGAASHTQRRRARDTLAEGRALKAKARTSSFIAADLAFHEALYDLSGNAALVETLAAQWPHLKRAMGVVLGDDEARAPIWAEHAQILERVLGGDAAGAEHAARAHAERAGRDTARRLAAHDDEG